jgi:PAS domain S-box-containing protein
VILGVGSSITGAAQGGVLRGDPDYEALFRAVFDRSRHAMLVVDDARRIRAANPAAAELTGHAVERLQQLALDDLHEPRSRASVVSLWGDELARGSEVGTRRLLLAEGGTVPVAFCGTRVAEDANLIVYTPSAGADDAAIICEHAGDVMPTLRQRQIITQLALGHTNDEIASSLVISPGTVRTHIRNAMRLTHSRNRAHLVAQALQRGWIVATA